MEKLVFHVPTLRGGGAERVWALMANEMARRGYHTTLLTWNGDGPNRGVLSPEVHLVDFGIPVRGERFGKPATIRGLLRMAGFFARHRPEAVFSAPEFANLVTAIALTLAGSGARFFPSFHAAAAHFERRAGSRLARLAAGLVIARATRAIAVSGGVAQDLARTAKSVRHKTVVIHNPLPPAFPGGADERWSSELATDPNAGPLIVTAGRLVEVKDHHTLLRAFARLRQTQQARLLILGEGPLQPELAALAAELGVAADVSMPGYVANPSAHFDLADLFVLSSTSEGFGNVLIEAMAAGLPIVSTDCRHGPREILQDGEFGALVPVGDAAALAAAMRATLRQPTRPDQLRSRASDFALDRIGDQYEALLKL
ncbi:MAG: glycosyltransferase [Devosia sp.]